MTKKSDNIKRPDRYSVHLPTIKKGYEKGWTTDMIKRYIVSQGCTITRQGIHSIAKAHKLVKREPVL